MMTLPSTLPTKVHLLVVVIAFLTASCIIDSANSHPIARRDISSRKPAGTSHRAHSPFLPVMGRSKPKSPLLQLQPHQSVGFPDGQQSGGAGVSHHNSPFDVLLRKQQISLISAYIRRGKIAEAERIFDNDLEQPVALSADSDRLIAQLFNDAYGNDVRNVDHLLGFELSRLDQFVVGYETLYEGLKKNGQLETPQLVHLASLADYLTDINGEYAKLPRRYKDRFSKVKASAKAPANKVIANWAKKVLQTDYQSIVDFFGEIPTAAWMARKVVFAALEKETEEPLTSARLEKIFDFIRDVPSISATIAAMDELYTAIETRGPGYFKSPDQTEHRLAFSYIVEETFNYPDYPYIPQEDRNRLEAIRDAIWDDGYYPKPSAPAIQTPAPEAAPKKETTTAAPVAPPSPAPVVKAEEVPVAIVTATKEKNRTGRNL